MNITEIQKLNKRRENFELNEELYSDGTPVRVDVYSDAVNRKEYQVDKRLNRYRVANETDSYGSWINGSQPNS